MTSCDGTGHCLILLQCDCECYNEETKEYNELCICGHREHNGYCPSNCCILFECRNYKFCNVKQPQCILWCDNGMCRGCAVQMGRHTITNIIEECCVCLENKNMIILKCNHKVCNDCWYNITNDGFDTDERKPPLCPLCRNLNDWTN